MNLAVKVEKASARGKIHLSEACADRLRKAGKERWIRQRDDQVGDLIGEECNKIYFWSSDSAMLFALVKVLPKGGKGATNTYWLVYGSSGDTGDYSDGTDHVLISVNAAPAQQRQRLVRWNAEVLLAALRDIAAQRVAQGAQARFLRTGTSGSAYDREEEMWDKFSSAHSMPLEEVREIIFLPAFKNNTGILNRQVDVEVVEIPDEVVAQLTTLVDAIASMYNQNFFHNFQHASHGESQKTMVFVA